MTSEEGLVGKRLDSLARNRAKGELARIHDAEYAELVQKYKHELRVEYAVTGIEPPRDRNAPLHVEGEEGRCAHCTQAWPCSQKRKRDAEAERRKKMTVPKDFDEMQTAV